MGACSVEPSFQKRVFEITMAVWGHSFGIDFSHQQQVTCYKQNIEILKESTYLQLNKIIPNTIYQGNLSLKFTRTESSILFDIMNKTSEPMILASQRKLVNEQDVIYIGRNNKHLKLKKIVIKEPFNRLFQVPEGVSCRFCYISQFERDNPLVSPCKCQGSVKYVHYKCLKSWIATEISDGIVHKLQFIKQECQICKENMVNSQKLAEIFIRMARLDFDKKAPFIILEGLKRVNERSFIFFSFDEKKGMILGRPSPEVDIHFDDVELQKVNSVLYIENDKFYIKDCETKYGTRIERGKGIRFERAQQYEDIVYDNMVFGLKMINGQK